MNPQNAIRGGVRKDLHPAFGVTQGSGTSVGSEWEHTPTIRNPDGLQLLLGLSHGSDLGLRVDHGRNGVVVDVTVSGDDSLNAGHSLFLGLVCQHGAGNHVAHGEDAGR